MRAIAILCLVAGVAHAEDKADLKFREGKKLLAAKKYAEACKAFEASYQLDPGLGAQLNIAHCYEEWGRLATALGLYKEAEQTAIDKKDNRLAKIKERISEVEPQVPRLTVHVSGDGGELYVDDKPAKAEVEILVDPGPHVVEVRRGTDKRSKTVPLEAGGSSEVKLDTPPLAVAAAPAAPSKTNPKKLAGIGLGAGGVVAMGVASAITLRARSRYKDALAGDCMGSTSMCDDNGISATHTARKEANIATIVFAGGVVMAGAGVYLYLTAGKDKDPAKEHAWRVVPTGTGFAVTGGF